MRVRSRLYERIRDPAQIAQRLDELATRAEKAGYAVTRESDGTVRVDMASTVVRYASCEQGILQVAFDRESSPE
ncbi:MAG: hypothetical protein ACYCYO_01815 [Bacilli bacterium]